MNMLMVYRVCILFVCAMVCASCAKPQLRPNSPEEETASFVGALFENPFK